MKTRIAVLLGACVVFAALLIIDTGALLGLTFTWLVGGTIYRWAIPLGLLACAVLFWTRKRRRPAAPVRTRGATASRRAKSGRTQTARPAPRKRRSAATGSRR